MNFFLLAVMVQVQLANQINPVVMVQVLRVVNLRVVRVWKVAQMMLRPMVHRPNLLEKSRLYRTTLHQWNETNTRAQATQCFATGAQLACKAEGGVHLILVQTRLRTPCQ